MSDENGILKDFNPLVYYGSKGHKTKQAKKIRKWSEYVPRFVEYQEKSERKRNTKIDQAIQKLVDALQTQPFVEIKDVDVRRYMRNMYKACVVRGVHLKFSSSKDSNSVFVRLNKE